MSTTTDTEDTGALESVVGVAHVDQVSLEPGGIRVDVPLGQRVMVVSDLLLTPDATTSTLALTSELAQALDTWDGPGILIIAGNLFDLTGEEDPVATAGRAIDAHPALAQAFIRFLGVDDRRVLRQRGSHEPETATAYPGVPSASASDMVTTLASAGVEHLGPVDLHLVTGTGVRVVRVDPGDCPSSAVLLEERSGTPLRPTADTKPGAVHTSPAGHRWRSLVPQSTDDAPWLEGMDHLSDPSALTRFMVSRTMYRRFGRYAWWLLVPVAVALLIRVAATPGLLDDLGSGLPARALRHAHAAGLKDQLLAAVAGTLVVLAVMAVALGLLSRRMWSVLGGGALEEIRTEAGANDNARDDARRLVAQGYAGLITAATFKSELTNLGTGFYANVGATTEVVSEHRGRFGLPRCSCGASGSAGSNWSQGQSSTSGCSSPITSWPRPAGSSGSSPGDATAARSARPSSPPTPPAPHGPLRPTCATPTARLAVSGDGARPPSWSQDSSTSSTRSPRRCAAASTCWSSSCHCGRAWPLVHWWPWPDWP